jgi:hypothetical protein
VNSGLTKIPRKEAARCGHCHLDVSMTLQAERRLRPSYSLGLPILDPSAVNEVEELWLCSHCDKPTIRLIQHLPIPLPGGMTEWKRLTVTIYPKLQPRELDSSAPDPVRSAFAEAALCQAAGAMRAAGVMYRSAVEEICKDRSATGSNLYNKIESLVSQGLDQEVVNDLHEARMLGNDSIHDGLQYSADEVDDVANLIEEAVYALYIQPHRKAAYRQKRNDRRNRSASPRALTADLVEAQVAHASDTPHSPGPDADSDAGTGTRHHRPSPMRAIRIPR